MAKRITASTLARMKNSEKIAMITAYDYATAMIVDKCSVDAVLVGDSLGMVVLGYDDTTQVTMEDMIHHIKAVSRGVKNALVIGDMPFLSYHTGKDTAVLNAGRLISEGHAQAVKLEGGSEIAEEIKAIIKAGIPVMGHIGLTPQSVHKFGGYFVQGKTLEQGQKLIDDALALEAAGVFGIVLECIPAELAEIITAKLLVPTIGIGAGNACDGQVLVINDMIGLNSGYVPSFVKPFANVSEVMENAIKKYSA
jgi:3-methyl-2-oxobutanoate hydroxymethyltransferase